MTFYRSLCLLIACLTLLVSHPAVALDVVSIRFGAHPDKQRAVIELSKTSDFRAFVLTNPTRLVVDLPDLRWKAGNVPIPAGLSVKDVRYGSLGGGISRLVLETTTPVLIQSAFMLPRKDGQPDRLVIDFKNTTPEIMSSLENQIQGSLQGGQSTAKPNNKSVKPKKPSQDLAPTAGLSSPPREKPLVIIDPGHGGQDPGAIGATGIYEKTIVLAVGKELARQLENSGKYRVKMTRDSDIFIPLRQRVMIARKHKASLFLSLHADSIRNASITGASVYTLSDKASDAETEKLAERENKSDLIAGVDLTHQEEDVANILIDLAARDTMNQSRFLAKTVIDQLDDTGVKVVDHNHRSAGFAVLKAMDIPSILVEMGYLTNRSEVEKLSSPAHRQKIAKALKASIDRYFEKVPK
ncbi:MAG: N-acetylmuramoyl-L-alanine amidase [Alphaproteobacteria bacterium]|nr:N-acetylmuramoyl-L-alanine amidase [Alphaproteobacteria bacterium]